MNSKNVYQVIFEEFNKTQNDINEDVHILKEWCKEQPHFPEIPCENFLRNFIINNKFSIEKAKSRLDMYYAIRNMMPEIFEHHPLSPEIIHHGKVATFVPHPELVNDFEQIIWIRVKSEFKPEELLHDILIVQNIHLYELFLQGDPILKYHFIIDTGAMTMAHGLRFSIMNIKKFTIFHEKVYGFRLASMYIINVKPFSHTLLKKFIKFFSPKLQARIIITLATKEIFEKFGKSTLPKDYGGENISLDEMNEKLIQKYKEKKSLYEKLQHMKSNENLRPASLKNDDILGYYGTFKTINID